MTTRKTGRLGAITGLRVSGQGCPIEATISQVSGEGRNYFTVTL